MKLKLIAALAALFVVGAFVPPASAHPMPKDTRDAELYFAHRCADSPTKAVLDKLTAVPVDIEPRFVTAIDLLK